MNKTENKKKRDLLRKYRSDILGITAFFGVLVFIVWIGSLGFYW